MKKIFLDVSRCEDVDEFYETLLCTLGAPDWHGRNLDALWDSITSDTNKVTPPYCVVLFPGTDVSPSVAALLHRVKALFEEAREQRGIEVEFTVG